MRKRQGVPPVDAMNGKIKQKSVSVMGSNKNQISREKEVQYLAEYRQILKDVLRQYNDEFEARFGHQPQKDQKEVLRSLYMEYKALKQYVAEDFDEKAAGVADPTLKQLVAQLV